MILDEMSIDKARQETSILYKNYKNKFSSLSELIQFISKKLNLSINEILQILEYTENINRGNKMNNRYIRKFKEQSENSLSNLTDVSLIDKLVEFFKSNPYPTDNMFHNFAKSINVEPDMLEQYVYAMICTFICGGKSIEISKIEKDFDPKEIESGKKVEIEHLDIKTDNPIIKKIVDIFSEKITKDHLSESNPLPYYNPYLKDMEDKIKTDKNK